MPLPHRSTPLACRRAFKKPAFVPVGHCVSNGCNFDCVYRFVSTHLPLLQRALSNAVALKAALDSGRTNVPVESVPVEHRKQRTFVVVADELVSLGRCMRTLGSVVEVHM